MEYTINNIYHKPHDLDDDKICFHFDIHVAEPESVFIKDSFVSYHFLLDFIHTNHPDFYKYIDETRRSIDGFGPCETRTVEAIGDDAVRQLYVCLEECIRSSDLVEKELIQHKEWQKKTQGEQAQSSNQVAEVFKELSEGSAEMMKYQDRYRLFCEKVTKEIRATATRIFPEIEHFEPEQLREFQTLFVTDIINMHDKIEKLLSEKK